MNNILYVVDKAIYYKSTGQTIITGWNVDQKTDLPSKISLPKISSASYRVKRAKREDVFLALGFGKNSRLGFEIVIDGMCEEVTIMYHSESYVKSALQKITNIKKSRTIHDDNIYFPNCEDWLLEEKKSSKSVKFSILIPVYNVEIKWLDLCIKSIQKQVYNNWELCIADDNSKDHRIRKYLKKLAKSDSRVKVVFREENGHISKASNSALKLATGDFIVLVDNDDEISDNALFEVAGAIKNNSEVALVYSDEDKIDELGLRYDPHFKPDWSFDLLMCTNYISHLGVYRRDIVEKIGGFRAGFEGAQDYDLLLRFTKQIDSSQIVHIPKILYHWRILPKSAASDSVSKKRTFDAGKKTLQDFLDRCEIKGVIKDGINGAYDVNYEILSLDLVSIIIPTRDHYNELKKCLDSITNLTKYPNYEIIIADNGSTDKRLFELYEKMKISLGKQFKVEKIDIPFNYSCVNNIAVKNAAEGKYLLFLNNDTEILSDNWIDLMVAHCQLADIGCVGAKLYYPTGGSIQHAGVILGKKELDMIAVNVYTGSSREELGHFGSLLLNVNYLALTGACLLVKAEDYEAVGGFEEKLKVQFNDVDFCLKIYELGKRNVWLHNVELIHHEFCSRGRDTTPEEIARSRSEVNYMHSKWGKYIEYDPYTNVNLKEVF